jgi:hypothetical protein
VSAGAPAACVSVAPWTPLRLHDPPRPTPRHPIPPPGCVPGRTPPCGAGAGQAACAGRGRGRPHAGGGRGGRQPRSDPPRRGPQDQVSAAARPGAARKQRLAAGTLAPRPCLAFSWPGAWLRRHRAPSYVRSPNPPPLQEGQADAGPQQRRRRRCRRDSQAGAGRGRCPSARSGGGGVQRPPASAQGGRVRGRRLGCAGGVVPSGEERGYVGAAGQVRLGLMVARASMDRSP